MTEESAAAAIYVQYQFCPSIKQTTAYGSSILRHDNSNSSVILFCNSTGTYWTFNSEGYGNGPGESPRRYVKQLYLPALPDGVEVISIHLFKTDWARLVAVTIAVQNDTETTTKPPFGESADATTMEQLKQVGNRLEREEAKITPPQMTYQYKFKLYRETGINTLKDFQEIHQYTLSAAPTQICNIGDQLICFLCDGSQDSFLLTPYDNHVSLMKIPIGDVAEFPELAIRSETVSSATMRFVSRRLDETTRLSCVCLQNGLVDMFIYNNSTLIQRSKYHLVGPATSAVFFKTEFPFNDGKSTLKLPPKRKQSLPHECWNLICTSCLDEPIIFRDIFKSGMDAYQRLPDSLSRGNILTSQVSPIEHIDPESPVIFLGTSSGHVLLYECNSDDEWQILVTINVGYAVYSIDLCCVLPDPLREMVCFTQMGLSVWQLNLDIVMGVLKRRLTEYFEEIAHSQPPAASSTQPVPELTSAS